MEHDQHGGGGKPQEPENNEALQPTPQIYVASLADYVDGRLHGAWLHVGNDVDELERQIAAMLAASPMPGAEEWAIHDYDGFGPLRLSEHESLPAVAAVADGIRQHGEAFAHFAALHGELEDTPSEDFEHVYLGHWDSLSTFAEELWDDMGYQAAIDAALPESLQPYVKFDAEAYGRDLELGGDIVTSEGDGGVYVFGAP